jgi:hypothetical protein
MKQYLDLLLRLDQFIRQKGTGSPPDFARKMGISERSLYEYLKVLKGFGAPIKFSRQGRSYYYASGGQFHIHFGRIAQAQPPADTKKPPHRNEAAL